jgi:hypothetical protein
VISGFTNNKGNSKDDLLLADANNKTRWMDGDGERVTPKQGEVIANT